MSAKSDATLSLRALAGLSRSVRPRWLYLALSRLPACYCPMHVRMKGLYPMSNGTIPPKGKSIVKDVISLLMLLSGLVLLTVGLSIAFGNGGVLIFWGAALVSFGIVLGFSRSGKE